MAGDDDTERWIGSLLGMGSHASALMRRKSPPGRRERTMARLHPSTLIGDAAEASLISPINEITEPGISLAMLPVRGMSTMFEHGKRPRMKDLRRFARLHPDAVEAMLPACLEAERTIRSLPATIDPPGSRSMYIDRVSRGREMMYDGSDTYAADLGERDKSTQPDNGAIVLSPAAMFAAHAARHLIAAPLLAPPDADDATIIDMAATGWIPEDDMIATSDWSRKSMAKRTLAGMGGMAWPNPKHIDPEALTWMMGRDMTPAIRMERDCLRWHQVTTASTYDLAWAAPLFSGEFKDMDGHDMAILWKDTTLMLIRFALTSDTPVPPLEPSSIRSLAGPAPERPVWLWDTPPEPSNPDDDDARDRAFRLICQSMDWPTAQPDAADMKGLLDGLDDMSTFDTAHAAIGRSLTDKDLDRNRFITPIYLFMDPLWRGMGTVDRLRADLVMEMTNAIIRNAIEDGATVGTEDVRWAATAVGNYPDDFILNCLEAGR